MKDKKSKKFNVVKVIAVVVIVIFCIVLVWGLFGRHRFQPHFDELTDSQNVFVKSVAESALSSMGKNVSDYEITIHPMMRDMGRQDSPKVLVSFKGQVDTQDYLIDVSSGKVLMHSEFFDGFQMPKPDDRWLHRSWFR